MYSCTPNTKQQRGQPRSSSAQHCYNQRGCAQHSRGNLVAFGAAWEDSGPSGDARLSPCTSKLGSLHSRPRINLVNLQYHKSPCCAVRSVLVLWHFWQGDEFSHWPCVCTPFNVYLSCVYLAIIPGDHFDDSSNWPQLLAAVGQ